MPHVRKGLELLGRVRLILGREAVERLPNQRVTALLGYLALHSGWQLRSQVAEAVWPEMPEGRATASLRNALSMLRRVIDPTGEAESPLETTRTHCRLSKELFDCDVWKFEESIRHQDFTQAVGLYHGDLLPDLMDDWLIPYRQHFRAAFVTAAAQEAPKLIGTHPDQAILVAQRWQAIDPFDPEPVKVVALAYAATGQSHTGLQVAQQYIAGYRSELGSEPDLDLTELREQIAKQPQVRPTSQRPEIPKEAAPNLPIYLTQFFGRDAEMEQILDWAQGPGRLLTIVGTGGIGKTRISIEAGRVLAKENEVKFVSLAAAYTAEAIIAGLMVALEVPESETETPKEALKADLGQLEKPTVLILDNLEQVVSPAAEVVMELLLASENLKVLCTSRELLGIEGERLLALAPFEIPEEDQDGKSVAVEMFLDRARSTRPDFAITPQNYHDVLGLCRQLDGLPLAIEIMAGWTGTWSVAKMRETVRFDQVTARKRGHEPRHQSLEACIDWSFSMLEAKDQELLATLSLFRGGWTLDSAAAVAEVPKIDEAIAALVDRSLIHSSEIGGTLRFSMLEAVRVFCEEKEASPGASERFVAYYRKLASQLTNPCVGEEEARNHRWLDRERDNIQVAVRLCEEGRASLEDGLTIVAAMMIHWVYRMQWATGISFVDRLLAIPFSEVSPGRVLALLTLSVLTLESGDLVRSNQVLAELQELAVSFNDGEIRFRLLTEIGNVQMRHSRFELAVQYLSQALDLAQSFGHASWEAVAHCNLAEALFGLDRLEEAMDHWRLANDKDRLSGNTAGDALFFLAISTALQGDAEGGAAYLKNYLDSSMSLDYVRGMVRSIHCGAAVAVSRGHFEEAQRLATSAKVFLSERLVNYNSIEMKFAGLVDEAIPPDFQEGTLKPLSLEEAINAVAQAL